MESFLKEIVKTSLDIYNEGWAEANAGNITVRLDEAQLRDRTLFNEHTAPKALDVPVPALGGEYFLVTAAGSQMRNVCIDPGKTCGVIHISADGTQYKIVWGLENTRPTSEFFAHLLSHQVRKPLGERVMLHTHPVTLVGICHAMALDTKSLTRLLWSMHPEGVVLYPEGIAYLPFMVGGSSEISKATCEAFAHNGMVLWEYHGLFASGASLDHAYGKVQAAEKAAKIYLAACQMGGVCRALDAAQIRAVADSQHIMPYPGILD